MKTSVQWTGEGLQFEGRTQSGAVLLFDGKAEQGPTPMETVQMALGACSAIDVVMILQKMRQDIRGCRCELDAERRDEVPKVFTSIKAHYVVSGHQLDPKKVEQAVLMSHQKYCSVGAMLQGSVELGHSFEVIELE